MTLRRLNFSMWAGLVVSAAVSGAIGMAEPAAAHTLWLEPDGQRTWRAMFGGHGGETLPYPIEKLTSVRAVDKNGKAIRAAKVEGRGGVHIRTDATPAVIYASFDNGIHTKRRNGPPVEQPMNRVAGAISATKAVKYHKTIVNWGAAATRPYNQPFEVIPLDSRKPVAGLPMRVRMLINGQPRAGVAIARNEEGQDVLTDKDGVARYIPVRGFNKLWAGKRTQVRGNPAYTELSIEYALGFFVD